MSEFADHLFVLQLDSCDSEAQLKAAYRREIREWHPDRFHGDPVSFPQFKQNLGQLLDQKSVLIVAT